MVAKTLFVYFISAPHVRTALVQTVMSSAQKHWMIDGAHRVANWWPRLSLMCTMSNPPWWRSRCVTSPTRPKLWPPVIMHTFPVETDTEVATNLTHSWTADCLCASVHTCNLRQVQGLPVPPLFGLMGSMPPLFRMKRWRICCHLLSTEAIYEYKITIKLFSAGALPQTPLGELTTLSDTRVWWGGECFLSILHGTQGCLVLLLSLNWYPTF